MSFVRLGKLEVDLDELRGFIVKAKKNCYAGNGEEGRLPDGSKILTFQEGNFHYTDNYDGYYQAPGSEIVRWQKPEGQRIWQMSYSGGMSLEFRNESLAKETFDFLKKALKQISPDKPFRGPEPLFFSSDNLSEGDFVYSADTDISESFWRENFTRFRGIEEIRHRKQRGFTIFSQDYIGGLVIPK